MNSLFKAVSENSLHRIFRACPYINPRYSLNLNTRVACGRTFVVKLCFTAESLSPVHKSRH